MKKTVYLLVVGLIIFLSGCQTTKEVTLDAEGKGNYISTTDMSGMIGMAKMSIPAEKLDSMPMGERGIDTTIALETIADMIEGLTDAEKAKIKKGFLGLTIDMKNEKFVTKLSYPIGSVNDIPELDKLSTKVIQDFMKKKMEDQKQGGGGMMPNIPGAGGMFGGGGGDDDKEDGMPPAIDEFFTMTSSKSVIERKLDTKKFEALGEQEKEGMKQMASMGMGNTTLIINLPKPVKKTEGKNITVSEDKKKVTIETSAEDFADDAKSLEFRIEY